MSDGFLAQATPALRALRAYDPGHDLPSLRAARAPGALIELGSNENAWGPSPQALAAIAKADPSEVWRYPDPRGLALRERLATLHGVALDEIVLGNGSHELLMQLAQIFCAAGDELLHAEYGFAVYPIAARAVGAEPVAAAAQTVGSAMPRGLDLAAMAARVSPRTRLVCIANPNNPTGTWVGLDDLAEFLAGLPSTLPVVIDEAYIEFADAPGLGSALALRARFPNLVVTRTFSKAYGLAGLRVGYAIADRQIVALIDRLRESFNVNALALLSARAALDDPGHLAQVVGQTRAEREWLRAELIGRGYPVAPSQGNFLLVEFGAEAARIEQRLLGRGVVLRPMQGYGLPQCLRVTVATRAENQALLEALT
ncbi:MAG: histidinol-phosphate transaminase [Lysobacterales bacterium]